MAQDGRLKSVTGEIPLRWRRGGGTLSLGPRRERESSPGQAWAQARQVVTEQACYPETTWVPAAGERCEGRRAQGVGVSSRCQRSGADRLLRTQPDSRLLACRRKLIVPSGLDDDRRGAYTRDWHPC